MDISDAILHVPQFIVLLLAGLPFWQYISPGIPEISSPLLTTTTTIIIIIIGVSIYLNQAIV